MKFKLVMSAILAFVLLLSMTSVVNAAIDSITYNDDLDDVELVISGTLNVTDQQDLDIKQIICSQSGKTITLTLKLNGGVIRNATNVGYVLTVTTSANKLYTLFYGDLYLLEEDEEFKGIVDSVASVASASNEEDLNYIDIEHQYSGIGTDSLVFEFDLSEDNERFIYATATVLELDSVNLEYYMDDLNFIDVDERNMLYPDVGGPYTAKINEVVNFNGSLETGNESDYEWYWILNEIDKTLYGTNPSYTFKVKGSYSGNLHVFDSNGKYGIMEFYVEVEGSSTGDNGDTSASGGLSGLTMFIILIAVVVIAGVAVVIYFLRK